MMINAGDVSALLLRLDGELQAITTAKAPRESISFASRLTAAIDRMSPASVADGASESQGNTMAAFPAGAKPIASDEAASPQTFPHQLICDEPDVFATTKDSAGATADTRAVVDQAKSTVMPETPLEALHETGKANGKRIELSVKLGQKAARSVEKKASSGKSGSKKDGGWVNADIGQQEKSLPGPVAQTLTENSTSLPPASLPRQASDPVENTSAPVSNVNAVSQGLKRHNGGAWKPKDVTSAATNSRLKSNQDADPASSVEIQVQPATSGISRKASSPASADDTIVAAPQVGMHDTRLTGLHIEKPGIDVPRTLSSDAARKSSLPSPGSSLSANDRSIVATPTSLEVGVANGSHGWVKIRTELTESGDVKASLAPTTAAGERMLHRELPGLSGFLHQEKLAVSSIVVQQVTSGGASPGAADQGGTGQFQQQSSNHSQSSLESFLAEGQAGEVSSADQGGDLLLPYVDSNAGGWLSIRA